LLQCVIKDKYNKQDRETIQLIRETIQLVRETIQLVRETRIQLVRETVQLVRETIQLDRETIQLVLYQQLTINSSKTNIILIPSKLRNIDNIHLNINCVGTSDVARPLSYKIKTTYFFKTRPVRPRPRSLFQD